ncbi:MAG: hypothetical protein QM724_13240 [Flavobacteriales bacterium]
MVRTTGMKLSALGIDPETDGVALAELHQVGDVVLPGTRQGAVHDIDAVLDGEDLGGLHVTQPLGSQGVIYGRVREQAAEAVAADRLAFAVLDDLLGGRAIAHDDEVLDGGQGLQGEDPVQAGLHGLAAAAQQGGQLLVQLCAYGSSVGHARPDKAGVGVQLLHVLRCMGWDPNE